MDRFESVSEYQPTGDQPQAIAELVEGFKQGNQFQTSLFGVIYPIFCGLYGLNERGKTNWTE